MPIAGPSLQLSTFDISPVPSVFNLKDHLMSEVVKDMSYDGFAPLEQVDSNLVQISIKQNQAWQEESDRSLKNQKLNLKIVELKVAQRGQLRINLLLRQRIY